jgi:PST family polysaccharide transporter
MALAFTVFAEIVIDMGLIIFTINKKRLSHSQWSGLFWINTGLGMIMALVAISLSPLVGNFYNNTDVGGVIIVLGLGFIPAGLAIQPYALLVRQLRFGRIAVIELFSLIIAGAMAVKLALSGYGPYAIVSRILVLQSIKAVLLLLSSTWKPKLFIQKLYLKEIALFSKNLTIFNIVRSFPQQFDRIIIGRSYGKTATGLYTRAFALTYLPIVMLIQPLMPILLSSLSKLQDNTKEIRNSSLKFFRIAGLVSFPVFFSFFIATDDVVHMLYGYKWIEIVPLFKILVFGSIWQAIIIICEGIFIASGKLRLVSRIAIAKAVVLGLSFVVGLHWGARGVASAYTIGTIIMLFPYLKYTAATFSLKVSTIINQMLIPLLASLLMAFTILFFRYLAGDLFHWQVRFVLSMILGIFVYFLMIWPTQKDILKEYYRLFKEIVFFKKHALNT